MVRNISYEDSAKRRALPTPDFPKGNSGCNCKTAAPKTPRPVGITGGPHGGLNLLAVALNALHLGYFALGHHQLAGSGSHYLRHGHAGGALA